jgi:hypothetical protein
MFGHAAGLFISLLPEQKRNEPKRKFAGDATEAKNSKICTKTHNAFASLS